MTDTRLKWGNCPPIQPPRPVPTAFESLVTRCFSGDFHTFFKKSAFLRAFLRFCLAFCLFLRYSPFRPEFFRWYMGELARGLLRFESEWKQRIKRISILNGMQGTYPDQG